MNDSEVRRLELLYSEWSDDELRQIANQPSGYTDEARAAALRTLRNRGADATIPSRTAAEFPILPGGTPCRTFERGICHGCGEATDVNRVPFVVARKAGHDWTPTLATAAVSAVLLPLGVGTVFQGPSRRLRDPLMLKLDLCDDCCDRWADSRGWLPAESYCLHPDYDVLEAAGYDAIIDERELPKWRFS